MEVVDVGGEKIPIGDITEEQAGTQLADGINNSNRML